MRSIICIYFLLALIQHVFSRQFVAAPKHSSLKRSDVGFQPCHDTRKLVYYSDDGTSEMGTSVTLHPKIPTFVEEDMDHHLMRCACSSGYMQVEFQSEAAFTEAVAAWSNADQFAFITSSTLCGSHGEHTPYLVQLVYVDPLQHRVILKAEKTHLRDITENMYFDMGPHVIPELDDRVHRRNKRDLSSLLASATSKIGSAVSSVSSAATSKESSVKSAASSAIASVNSVVTSAASSAANVASSLKSDASSAASSLKSVATSAASNIASKVSSAESYAASKASSVASKISTKIVGTIPAGTNTGFPSFTFSSTPGAAGALQTQAPLSINLRHIDTTLIPPDNSILAFVSNLTVPHVSLKCLNCTMLGSFGLKAANFSTNGDLLTVGKDFFHNGYLEFDANDVVANISLELGLEPGFNLALFQGSLPRRTLGSVSIAGILSFSPVMDFNFPMWLTLNSPVIFQAGFIIPPISAGVVHFDIDKPETSYAKGFDSKPRFLPFNANAPDLDFNISIAFRPQISINAGFVMGKNSDIKIDGGVGVFIDLPKFSAKVSSKNNVDNNCIVSSGKSNKAYSIVSGFEIDTGAFYELEGFKVFSKTGQYSLTSNNHTVEPQCLRWDTVSNSLVATSGDFRGISTTNPISGGIGGIGDIVLTLGAKIGIGIGGGIGGLALICLIVLGVWCCRRRGGRRPDKGGRYMAARKLGRRDKGLDHGVPTEYEMNKTGPHVETTYVGSYNSPESIHSPQWNEKSNYQALTASTTTHYGFSGGPMNDSFAMDPYQAQYASDPHYNNNSAHNIQADEHINPIIPMAAVGTYSQKPSSPPRIVRKPTAQEKRSLSSMSVPSGHGINPAYSQVSSQPQPHSQPLLNRYNSEPPYDPNAGYSAKRSRPATYPYPEHSMTFGGGGWANVKSGDGSQGLYSSPGSGRDDCGNERKAYTMYQDNVSHSQPAWERPLVSQGYDQGYQGSGLVKFEKIKLGR